MFGRGRLDGRLIGQPFGCRGGGLADLGHQAAEVGFFDRAEAAGAVLGRKAPGVDGLADEGAVGIAPLGLQLCHGDHLIDDPRQFQPGLRSVDLRLEDLAIEVVELLVEDAHEPDILGSRVLQMREPGDHLAAVQPVSPTHIRLAGLFRQRLGLALAPLKAEPPGDGDRVDEDSLKAVKLSRITELLADGGVVRRAIGLLVAQAGVRAADEHCEIPAFRPCARPDAVAGPAFDGKIASFQIHEQRSGGIQCPQEAGLADTGFPEDTALDAARFGQPLVGGDDGQAHCAPPCGRISTLRLPVRTVRAGSKP